MNKLVFSRSDDVDVSFICTLKDAENMDENFTIMKIIGLETSKEMKLFYAFTKGFMWTLNEMAFFAVCKGMCLQVLDENSNVLNAFGTCGSTPPVGDFNNDFNEDFFI